MREEASILMFKVRALNPKLEIDDQKLPKKRKVPSHYEEGEAPIEIVSIVEEYYHQIFIPAEYYIETVQAKETLRVKKILVTNFSNTFAFKQ